MAEGDVHGSHGSNVLHQEHYEEEVLTDSKYSARSLRNLKKNTNMKYYYRPKL